MRISDWSSDVCSSDLGVLNFAVSAQQDREQLEQPFQAAIQRRSAQPPLRLEELLPRRSSRLPSQHLRLWLGLLPVLEQFQTPRSEEHTSELQSLMRISYAVFCLKKKN